MFTLTSETGSTVKGAYNINEASRETINVCPDIQNQVTKNNSLHAYNLFMEQLSKPI